MSTTTEDQAQRHPNAKSVAYALMLAARMMRARSATLLADLDLYPGQEQALQMLAQTQGMSMGELATALKVKAPTASKTVGRLSQQGLVTRRPAPGDARLVTVVLTPEGERRSALLEALAETIEDELTESMDGKDKRRLRKLLRKAARSLANAGGIEPEPADARDEPDSSDED